MNGTALVLTLDPAHIGGVQTMCRAVTRALQSLGTSSELAFLRSDRRGRWDPRLRRGWDDGRPTLSAGYWPTLEYLNYSLACGALRREIRRFSAVHVVSSFHSPSLVPILCGRPFVSWVATPFVDEIESRFRGGARSASVRVNYAARAVNQALERWTYRHPLKVWALSAYTARRLGEVAGLSGDRVEVQNAPVDTELFQPEGPRWARRPYLLSVGRLDDDRKNYPLLLRVFAREIAGQCDVDLVLAGPGAEGSGLPSLARELGVGSRVTFSGPLPGAELAAAYRGAQAFALCSRQEGLGLVVLEAQACGRPCIAMSCGGVEDLIADGETGLLIQQGQEAAFGRAVRSVLGNPDLAGRLGACARAKTVRTSSYSAFTARLRGLYATAFPGLVVPPSERS